MTEPDERRSRAWLLAIAAPLTLTLLLYLPACFGAGFISDDVPLIPGHLRHEQVRDHECHFLLFEDL